MPNKYFECDCHSEVLNIGYDEEDKLVYFAMYHYGQQDHRLSWKEIIRWTWHMIKERKLFNDELVFSVERAKEVGEYLVGIGEKEENEKEKIHDESDT